MGREERVKEPSVCEDAAVLKAAGPSNPANRSWIASVASDVVGVGAGWSAVGVLGEVADSARNNGGSTAAANTNGDEAPTVAEFAARTAAEGRTGAETAGGRPTRKVPYCLSAMSRVAKRLEAISSANTASRKSRSVHRSAASCTDKRASSKSKCNTSECTTPSTVTLEPLALPDKEWRRWRAGSVRGSSAVEVIGGDADREDVAGLAGDDESDGGGRKIDERLEAPAPPEDVSDRGWMLMLREEAGAELIGAVIVSGDRYNERPSTEIVPAWAVRAGLRVRERLPLPFCAARKSAACVGSGFDPRLTLLLLLLLALSDKGEC